MEAIKDPYYSRPEVSNSDLSWVLKYFQPPAITYDLEKAYRFGTLIDCMLTEPEKVNYYTFTCAGWKYLPEEFKLAEDMKKAFLRDPLCKMLFEKSETQKVSIKHNWKLQHDGFEFVLDARCKWDFYAQPLLKICADLKSTTATTQKQFEDACYHFQYFRQRAWYMDMEGTSKDMLIGVSKKNLQVFKIPITRGDKYHKLGQSQYQDLAFKYWTLFGDIKKEAA